MSGKWLVWEDSCCSEGWNPREFDTQAEAEEYATHHHYCMVTPPATMEHDAAPDPPPPTPPHVRDESCGSACVSCASVILREHFKESISKRPFGGDLSRLGTVRPLIVRWKA